jgi:hypothetical protein
MSYTFIPTLTAHTPLTGRAPYRVAHNSHDGSSSYPHGLTHSPSRSLPLSWFPQKRNPSAAAPVVVDPWSRKTEQAPVAVDLWRRAGTAAPVCEPTTVHWSALVYSTATKGSHPAEASHLRIGTSAELPRYSSFPLLLPPSIAFSPLCASSVHLKKHH